MTADITRGGRRGSLLRDGLATVNEPVYLAGLLTGWGRSARAAMPELLDLLPHRPSAAGRALAAVADAQLDPHVIVALRTSAEAGPRPGRVASATALHALTGDASALVAVLGPALGERSEPRDQWVRAAVSLGGQARSLLPQLSAVPAEPAETRTSVAAVRAGLAAAGAARELTGDQESVLPMVLEGLTWASRPWGEQAANSAAEVAVLLGPDARPAVPHLLAMLDRPDTAAAAARALVAVHPGTDRPAGAPLTDLVDRVRPSCPAGICVPRWPRSTPSPPSAPRPSPRPSSTVSGCSPTGIVASWGRAAIPRSFTTTWNCAPSLDVCSGTWCLEPSGTARRGPGPQATRGRQGRQVSDGHLHPRGDDRRPPGVRRPITGGGGPAGMMFG
ncbi:hypothetical protein AB0D33_18035 [Streptomyces sp. NPDC048404]|uniref:hypothetical protein n=1 Tax=unclassified Streptomyces TaxID=2593676 RepID=UPI003423C139